MNHAVLLVALSTLAPAALAQDGQSAAKESESPVAPEAEARKVNVELSVSGFATSSTDFEGDNGNVQVSSVGAELGVDIPAGERGTLSLGFGTSWSFFDFGGDAGFGASEPWEDVVEYKVSARYSRRLNEQWGFFVGGFVGSSGEQDADFSKTIVGGGFGGVSYAASERFRIGLGLGAATQLEDDVYVIPVVNINWKITDKWLLSSDQQPRGGGMKLSYQMCEPATIYVAAGYLSKEFRLDEDGATPDGVGQESGFPVAIGTDWKVAPQVSIGLRAGVIFGHEFELDDSTGDELQQLDADATPFLSGTLKFSF
ncbi:MAG: DUF6268 family outer membrane beta-barrel protein [Phycisphaerales bacterium]